MQILVPILHVHVTLNGLTDYLFVDVFLKPCYTETANFPKENNIFYS